MIKDRIEWLKAEHPEFLEHAIQVYQEMIRKELKNQEVQQNV